MSICDLFELASGAKVNRGKSKAMLFGNWVNQSFIPFTVRTDYLKVLGIWFRGAGLCAKTSEECITKVRQKLGRWEHRSLAIMGKNLVIRSELLSVLLYVKFVKENNFDHKSIRKWSAWSVLENLQEKERVDLLKWFTVQKAHLAECLISEFSNKLYDITWLV
eukprot:g29951.t1